MNVRRIIKTVFTGVAGLGVSTLVACGTGTDASSGFVNTSVALVESSSAATSSIAGSAEDSTRGPIRKVYIDSLMVTVTSVEVLPDSLVRRCHPPEGDSARGFRPGPLPPEGRPGPGDFAGPGRGPCGGPPPFGPPPLRPDRPRTLGDSLLPPDSGWGARPDNWYSLAVVGSGRLDLMHLPTDSTGTPLQVAADSLPAGDYDAARLVVDSASAKIWFNTQIVTAAGDTLQPNTAYPVLLPGRPGRAKGIMTDAGFTVPSGGGTVTLSFDAASAIRGAVILRNGVIVIGPMLHAPRR